MNTAALELESGSQGVLFALDAGRCALPLDSIERIVRAAEYTPLPPAAVDAVLGIVAEPAQMRTLTAPGSTSTAAWATARKFASPSGRAPRRPPRPAALRRRC